MAEFWKVIVLGIIEGITEWLPVSSTGHLILADEWIHLNATEAFKEMFQVVIQLGAILAVVVTYFDRLNPFSRRKTHNQRARVLQLWMKVIVACVPAAILGILFDDWLDEHLYNYLVVSVMLIVYGVLFILVENMNKGKKPEIRRTADLSFRTAFYIGLFQVLSLIPGTSRSGATIIGAMLLGVSRYAAAEFTFFLAIPVMSGASGLKLVKFMKNGPGITGTETAMLLTGCAAAFLISMVVIRFFMRYIKQKDFKVFGYYRIILGIIVLAYFFFV